MQKSPLPLLFPSFLLPAACIYGEQVHCTKETRIVGSDYKNVRARVKFLHLLDSIACLLEIHRKD